MKHAPPELLGKIRLLWQNVPAQLAKENKKFIYSALKSGARAREYETALQWLADAGMIRQVYRVSPPRLPPLSYQDFSAFKLYLHDIVRSARHLPHMQTGRRPRTFLSSPSDRNFRSR